MNEWEFGDTVYASATVVVISVLLFVPMDMIFGLELWLVSRAIFVLIGSIITGLIFASPLADARLVSTAKIIVLAAIVVMFLTFGILSLATFNDVSSEVNPEIHGRAFNGRIGDLCISADLFYVVLIDAIGFVGIYFGSILRKTKKI